VAYGRRSRQIAPVRKLIAAALGMFATFVILFGAGMTSWSIVVLGVALLALAITLGTVTSFGTGARAWITGVGRVQAASPPPPGGSFGRCELQIEIDAPGLPPRTVRIRDPRTPVTKWPEPGATLPIMVAIDDLRRVRILWDEVLTHAEVALDDTLPPEFDGYDPRDDELIVGDAPPWARVGDAPIDEPRGEPDTVADREDGSDTRRDDPAVRRGDGPVVLEGTLVEPVTPAPPNRPAERAGSADPSSGRSTLTAEPVTITTIDGATMAPPPRSNLLWDDSPTTPVQPDPIAVVEPTRVPEQPAPAASTAEPTGASAKPVAEPDPLPDLDGEAGESLADLIAAAPSARVGGVGTIQGVGITLLVTDLDRSVAFYRDVLGLFEIDGGDANAVLASGATRIVLRAIPDVAPINRRLVHLNLEVDDVEAVYAELRDKGVRFTYAPRAVNRGAKLELWAAAFRDPDGHGIAITQWRGRATETPAGVAQPAG
jgi:catechol 2,3-dioxygenase-like lactoylglutathione lyase family enzyme